MKEYNEFIKDFNCDGILKDFSITIKDNGLELGKYYIIQHPIKYLKPNESVGIRYSDSEDDYDFDTRYIKNSYFSLDGHKVLIELE